MAEQADFYVKNEFKESIEAYLRLPGGSHTSQKTIAAGETEMFLVSGFDVSLIVNTPDGKKTNGYYMNVEPDNGLPVLCKAEDTSWTLQIEPNNLPPQSPTTVNVNCGGDDE